jgi:hypothetical protein
LSLNYVLPLTLTCVLSLSLMGVGSGEEADEEVDEDVDEEVDGSGEVDSGEEVNAMHG